MQEVNNSNVVVYSPPCVVFILTIERQEDKEGEIKSYIRLKDIKKISQEK